MDPFIKKTTVKNSQKRSIWSKAVQPVKIGRNGQWRSKGLNTVKNGEKRSKMLENGEKEMVNKVKNGKKTG